MRFLASENKKLSELPDLADRIEAIQEGFLHRSYWNRLWVLQEIQHAAEGAILCGSRQIDFLLWALLKLGLEGPQQTAVSAVSAVSLVLRNNISDREILTALKNSWGRMSTTVKSRGTEVRPSLVLLLFVHNVCECSEPRDKVFALLNIEPTDISVDYRKLIADIFIDTTRCIIDQEQDLNIICSTQFWRDDIFRPMRNIQIPSWVPDYAS